MQCEVDFPLRPDYALEVHVLTKYKCKYSNPVFPSHSLISFSGRDKATKFISSAMGSIAPAKNIRHLVNKNIRKMIAAIKTQQTKL